jgi:hypothetical protein
MPRGKDNPNARGGAISIRPIAPNSRLDKVLNKNEVIKQSHKLELLDLLVSLGIE